jgi:hypothetical protein
MYLGLGLADPTFWYKECNREDLDRKYRKRKTIETSIPEYCQVGGCGSRLGDFSRRTGALHYKKVGVKILL